MHNEKASFVFIAKSKDSFEQKPLIALRYLHISNPRYVRVFRSPN